MRKEANLLGELEEHLDIDRDYLDEELIRQPQLFYQVSNLLVEAKDARDKAKADMDNIEVDLDARFREQLTEEGGEKPKETEIRRKIGGTKRMQAARQIYLDLITQVNRLEGLREAYIQKGHALRELASLYAANYFTVESGGKSRSTALDAAAERSRKEAGAMRRERRKED